MILTFCLDWQSILVASRSSFARPLVSTTKSTKQSYSRPSSFCRRNSSCYIIWNGSSVVMYWTFSSLGSFFLGLLRGLVVSFRLLTKSQFGWSCWKWKRLKIRTDSLLFSPVILVGFVWMSLLDACLVLDEPCDNCDDVVSICVMTVLNCYVFRFVYGTVRGLSLELATILHPGDCRK